MKVFPMLKERLEIQLLCNQTATTVICATLVLLACWPTARWYGLRMIDGSDEPWGILALFVAVGFAIKSFKSLQISPARLWGSVLCLLTLLVVKPYCTPLIQGLIVASAFSFLIVNRHYWVGHSGLLLLSLPLISSLQFYGGFPMRWLIGKASSLVLALLGQSVEVVGTVMRWQGEMIVIDAPCSGVQMLWSSGFFACTLVCFYKLDFWHSIKLLQATGFIAFCANVLRNCILFFVETGLVRLGEWAHDAVGVLVFVGALLLIGVYAKSQFKVNRSFGYNTEQSNVKPRKLRLLIWPVVSLGVVCSLLIVERTETRTLLFEGEVIPNDIATMVKADLLTEGWYPMPLDDVAMEYASTFPGDIQLFEKDNCQLVVRVIDRATRRYHKSADCYRAIGYSTKPMPLLKKVDGSLWGRVLAKRGSETVEVRERVVARGGEEWTDPSSWFWSALLGSSKGPWIAYSESEFY